MSRKFRLIMIMALLVGLLVSFTTPSTVSADPQPGTVVAIPRIDLDDVFGTGIADWDTKIQVQNLGTGDTGVIALFWGEYEGKCPPNDSGPMGHACMYMPSGGVWTLHSQIPGAMTPDDPTDDAYSAIVYSVGDVDVDGDVHDDFQAACAGAPTSTPSWRTWVATYEYTGAPLAVTADRWGTGPFGDFQMASSCRGISDDMYGPGPPYAYFSPYIMHGYNELDTTITIQNSGEVCTSAWIYYKEQGHCEFQVAQQVEAIAPGQAIRVGPGPDAHVRFPATIGRPWLGSVYVTTNTPSAVIVDQLSHAPSRNRGKLLTYRTMPYHQTQERTWYAGLVYRGISGWNAGIQVQNLTQKSLPTFVTVEFFDGGGGSLLFVGDWICRNGAATFYLPAITDLGINFPFGYAGAAEIQSHAQVDYPGGSHEDGEPIFAVVDLKKEMVYDESMRGWRHTVPGETQGGAYTTHPDYEIRNAWGWAMPFIAKEQEGVTSRIAIRNNSNCNKIKGEIWIKDETGTRVATIPVPWLLPKHMNVFDFAYLGQIARGFIGAAEFRVSNVEQLCDRDGDGLTDIEPVMPSVIVLNYAFERELPIVGGADL
jgi:hypothetical protein